jgi:hypothetical protein
MEGRLREFLYNKNIHAPIHHLDKPGYESPSIPFRTIFMAQSSHDPELVVVACMMLQKDDTLSKVKALENGIESKSQSGKYKAISLVVRAEDYLSLLKEQAQQCKN